MLAAQGDHEAPHTGVPGWEPVLVDEVLPDRHGIAAAPEGEFDQLAVGLAGARPRGPGGSAAAMAAARRATQRPHAKVGGHLTGRFCQVGGHRTARRPPGPGTRTHAATVSRCASHPQHCSMSCSIPALLRRCGDVAGGPQARSAHDFARRARNTIAGFRTRPRQFQSGLAVPKTGDVCRAPTRRQDSPSTCCVGGPGPMTLSGVHDWPVLGVNRGPRA
jgi:hypothetical protein